MSNLLQTLKTVTLSHEAVLTALCALGVQRKQDKLLLQGCAESGRGWVKREIALVDAAITGLQNDVYTVRYCPACGHVGDVMPPARDCCPDSQHAVMVPPHIAHQAQIGFQATLKEKQACAA